MQPLVLETRDLDDFHTCPKGADVHERLDLETVRVELKPRQHVSPERVVPVTQIGVATTEQQTNHRRQESVSELPVQRHVAGAAALREAGAFDEVGTGEQESHETGNLVRVGRSVRVEHDDDVAAGLGKATS